VVFRGHGSNKFPLRTSFHRTGRTRLERYCAQELRDFHQHSEAVSRLGLQLSNAEDYATVVGLAQHHGLPTPLLDWTRSPYIAAFFAFSDALEYKEHRPGVTHVRIYALTKDFNAYYQPPAIALPALQPYAYTLAVTPRHNPRLYAQQGQFLATNVYDLERFITELEVTAKRTFMFAVDVPVDCAAEALDDLSFMGLTAASLFPGLDGVGRMLRNKMFMQKSAASPVAIGSFTPSLTNEQGEK
jgi:hypothetical protein